MTSPPRRASVDLSEADARAALSFLPADSRKVVNGKTIFIDYSKRGMKLAPKWGDGVPFLKCIGKINPLMEARLDCLFCFTCCQIILYIVLYLESRQLVKTNQKITAIECLQRLSLNTTYM